jgi:hypothetical protein
MIAGTKLVGADHINYISDGLLHEIYKHIASVPQNENNELTMSSSSTEQSLSWEGNSRLDSKENLLLWNPKVHKAPQLDTVLSHLISI